MRTSPVVLIFNSTSERSVNPQPQSQPVGSLIGGVKIEGSSHWAISACISPCLRILIGNIGKNPADTRGDIKPIFKINQGSRIKKNGFATVYYRYSGMSHC